MVGTFSNSRLLVIVGSALLMALAIACTREVEVPGETVVVKKEVIKEVEVPGETVVVEKEVVRTVEVEVPVEKEVVKTVEVPGETVVVETIKEVEVMAQPEGYVHRALEPFPKRGGTLRTSWGFILPHFDYHQGPSPARTGPGRWSTCTTV